jgi:Co/Zn/Cd efflux system component
MSSHLLRSDLDPILGGYLILMAVLAVGLVAQRRRAAAGKPGTRLTGRRDRGWQALIVHVLSDALGGYLLLIAVVVLYYFGVAKVGDRFLASAITGSLLLLAISLPVFIAVSWLTQRPVKWSFRRPARLRSLRLSFRRSGRGDKADH